MTAMRVLRITVAGALVVAAAATAQTLKPHKIAKDHPIVGRWTYTLPDGSCTETYHFRSDGTSVVTSGDEIAESVFDIAAKPDGKGFYKWADELVKDNGKKDCAGEVTAVGKVVTYILDAAQFILLAAPAGAHQYLGSRCPIARYSHSSGRSRSPGSCCRSRSYRWRPRDSGTTISERSRRPGRWS
jgi:hypothetical protein